MYLTFMLLHLCPGIFIPAYILLCTFMMVHSHEHIYSIYLPILSMLSSGTCFRLFIPFMASMLPYFYMIHIAFVSWPGSGAFQYIRSIYLLHIFYPLGVCSTGAQCTWDTQGIYFLYTFLALYMIYCANYIPAFI